MSDRRWRLSAESITAAAAVVAAMIALAVGVWENVQDRRHNRLSVLPHLDFVAELRTTDTPDSVSRAVIRLVSEGVGPAIIDRVRIFVRDPSGTRTGFGSWGEAREVLERWNVRVRSWARLDEGSVLGVGREFALLTIEATEPYTPGEPHAFDQLLDRFTVIIDYRSIYGDQYRTTLGDEE